MMIDRSEISKEIDRECRDTRYSTKAWSFAYYGFMFTAAVLSGAAAVILKINALFHLDEAIRSDLAALFSMIASVIGVVATTGNFASKWSASRMARSALEQLRIRMLDTECDLAAVQDKLIQIRADKDYVFTQQATNPLPNRPPIARGSGTQAVSGEMAAIPDAAAPVAPNATSRVTPSIGSDAGLGDRAASDTPHAS
jgi:hypothetical protein